MGLYIKSQCLNQGVQEEDSWLNCTIWYKRYNIHTRSVRLQVRDAPKYSYRCGQYSQWLWNLHLPIVWFCRILRTTTHSSGYSCIVFHNFGNIEEHWWSSLEPLKSSSLCTQPIWEHLGASGRISVAVLSCWFVQLWLPNHFICCWCNFHIITLCKMTIFQ